MNPWQILPEVTKEKLDYFKSSIPRYDRITSFFNNIPIGSILDIGCSPGHNAIMLSRMGFHVTGLDLNDLWIPLYNPKWFKEFDRITCDIEKNPIPFESNSFDYVLFTEVLEHVAIRHPKEILKEINRVLKPNGVLYLTTPNVSNFSNILALLTGDNIFWKPEIFYGSTDRHNREYTWKELRDILLESGFGKVKIDFFSTWSNNRKFPATIISFLIKRNINHWLIDNTIEAIVKK